jgi:sec-independent protein translocase protein TatC
MAKRNPERRMNLGGHLRELRNRLYWSALFIAIAAVGGWFLFDPVFALLQQP